ncbi:pre-rRNA-processing protein pno1 [Tephrocybe rancida]|nr:pre-rRNA-processing protein pno1 [Tephrocybe rancida]
MVVSAPSILPGSSSTVATARKNRRKITRKAATTASPSKQITDEDQEMNDAEGSTSNITDQLVEVDNQGDDDELLIDVDPMETTAAPAFPPLAAGAGAATRLKSETRRIPIPPHRMTPLKKDWINIFGPLTEILALQVRMNVQRRCVEARVQQTSKETKDIGALQKGADFVKAYALGFDVNDAIALLRLDDLYLDSFEIKDVKTLHGDHLSRAIGRIAGQDGKTKFTIENASRTRIVLADTKIHIMGSFQNIKIARDAIVSLILGSPPGKVYAGLRTVSSRMRQRAL